MHVYSRHTLERTLSFPPIHQSPSSACAMSYSLSLRDDFRALSDMERQRSEPGSTVDGKPAPVARAQVYGYRTGEEESQDAIDRAIAMHGRNPDEEGPEDIVYGFSACHYTRRHLVCTAKSGAIFVVQDYKHVFEAAAELPEEERGALVSANTHMIGLGTTVRQLTTMDDHIVICTVRTAGDPADISRSTS